MKQTSMKKLLSFILCIVLIAAMALIASGCNANEDNTPTDSGESYVVTTLGTGQTAFNFTVVDKDGNKTRFEIYTDKTTVGDALLELKLIEGKAGAYGLYVKTVNGITADYDADQTYWAFYVNGEYATSGVDTTDIVAGATYTFKVEK